MDADPTVSDSPPACILDAQALAKLEQLDPGGKSGLVRRVLTTYAGSLTRLRQQIAEGLTAADHNVIRLGAHTLKSSSASIGALELSRLCADVESSVRDGTVNSLNEMIERLLAEIDRVEAALVPLIRP